MNIKSRQRGEVSVTVVVVVVVVVVLLAGLAYWIFGRSGPGTTVTTTTTTSTVSLTGTWGRVPSLIGNTPIGANYIVSSPGGGAPPSGATVKVRITFDGNVVKSQPASTSASGGLQSVQVTAGAGGLATVKFTAQLTGSTQLTAAVQDTNGNWIVDSDVRTVEVQTGVPSQ